MKEGRYVRLHLRVKAATLIGQIVAVRIFSCRVQDTKNIDAESFNWQTINLVTTPEAYPIWYSFSPLVIPFGSQVYYKYCILESGDIASYEGSDDGKYRKIVCNEDLDVSAEDIYTVAKVEENNLDSEAQLFEEMRRNFILPSASSSSFNAIISSKSRTGSIGDFDNNNNTVNVVNNDVVGRLFLVCYHLPVVIKRTSDPKTPFSITWSESLIAKSEDSSVSESLKTIWVGTVSVPGDDPSPAELVLLVDLLNQMNCKAIFLDKQLARNAYHGFCKEVMWPMFHNIDQLDQIHAAWRLPADLDSADCTGVLSWNTDAYMPAYQSVNNIFAETLHAHLQTNDILWVHDYHLMLLPQLIRQAYQNTVQIVFYLHIPFPTSQIFRSLPQATELLTSMTCADVVGFHTFDHARHFLNATKRILGIRSNTRPGGLMALTVRDREVVVSVNHVSIESGTVDKALKNTTASIYAAAEDIRKRYEGKKIIISVDVCERLSGGILKLAAMEKLMTDYSNVAGGVVLIQKMIRTGAREGDEETTSADMRAMVESINSKFKFVVDYEEIYSGMSLNERLALWLAADVFLLTPMKEGLNLYPLEFIYAKKNMERAGVVIVSEFSTCSSLLNGALKINPFHTLQVADTVHKALHMSTRECEKRRQRDLEVISSHPSSSWTKQILMDLREVQLGPIKPKKGSGKSNMKKKIFPSPLDSTIMINSFKAAGVGSICELGSRVFIFDYGGTLIHKDKFDVYIKHSLSAISGRKPTAKMLEVVEKLSEDPHNIVMVVTGLTKLKLSDTFLGMKNLTLVTSNGLVYSWGQNMLDVSEKESLSAQLSLLSPHGHAAGATTSGDTASQRPRRTFSSALEESSLTGEAIANSHTFDASGRKWQFMDFDIDWIAVRDIAVPITTKFTFRTNGTCQSPRIPGIGWSYFGADPDWGEKQASQLKIELEAALAKHDVQITSQIQGSIEVVPKLLHKGVMVKYLMSRVIHKRAGKLPDFIMVMGDEESDDRMYETLYEVLAESSPNSGLKSVKTYTVNVGKRSCPAEAYVMDVQDVEDLLTKIADA